MENRNNQQSRQIGSDDTNYNKQQLGVDGKFMWPVRIFSFLFFGATLAINYLIGLRTGQVSDKYHLWITPPGYYFLIWSVIYSTLAIVNIYNLIKNIWSIQVHIAFTISNCLNLIWIVVFSQSTNAAIYICSVILIALVPAILLTWHYLGKVFDEDYNIMTYITRNVFAFYLGWVIAATNLNFGMNIVFWWGASKQTQLIIFWIIAPCCAIGATIFNGIRQGKRGLLSCFCLWFSVIWAFTGAALTSNGCINGYLELC